LIEHIFKNYHIPNQLNILEPSCGSGIFIESILAKINELHSSQIDISLVEIDSEELKKAADIAKSFNEKNVKVDAYNLDFLDYHNKNNKKYTLIIGNPPYIKKCLMSEKQIKLSTDIFNEAGLPTKHINNIWPAFLVSSVLKLEENGILCLILPSELLQVKYSKQLREYILFNFEKIEIFAFNELIFEAVEQDIIILIGSKKVQNNGDKGIYFYQVEKLKDLNTHNFIQKSTNVHRKSLDKWTNYIIEDQDLNFIDTLSKTLNKVEFYCNKVNVGIVTAANSYFIVNDKIVKENNLQKYSTPILSNSFYLKRTLLFTKEDYNSLKSKNKKVDFVNFRILERNC
jgi:adenine-specific DNA-methyltransferase